EFIELLNVIYPPSKEISDANVDYLLKLSDRFDIDWLVYKCEQHLFSSSKLDIADKLSLSTIYRLDVLQDYCIDHLKTIKDVQNQQNSAHYKDFPDTIISLLSHKMMIISVMPPPKRNAQWAETTV
ncbi:hypothetical protein PENTCL1PPCAC_19308, partial [Pristionchus entomophagus]